MWFKKGTNATYNCLAVEISVETFKLFDIALGGKERGSIKLFLGLGTITSATILCLGSYVGR